MKHKPYDTKIVPISFSLPTHLLDLIEVVRRDRADMFRSATIRTLILLGLASLGYIEKKKRASPEGEPQLEVNE